MNQSDVPQASNFFKVFLILLLILAAGAFLTFLLFLVGIVLWNVPNRGSNAANGPSQYRSGPNRRLAAINGEPIYADTFDKAFQDALVKEGQTADLNITLRMRNKIFGDMLQRIVANQVLNQFGVKDMKKQVRAMAEEVAGIYLRQLRMGAEMQAQSPEAKQSKRTPEMIMAEAMRGYYEQMRVKAPENPTEDGFKKFYVETLTDPRYGQADEFAAYARIRLIGQRIIERDLPNLSSDDYMKKVTTQMMDVRWIFIPAADYTRTPVALEFTPRALEAARAKTQKLHDQIVKNPSAFAAIASKESQHLSHTEGGRLGWISSGDPRAGLPAIVEYLIFSQKPKELGPVTRITLSDPNPENALASKVGFGFVQVISGPQPRQDLGPNFNWEAAKKDLIPMSVRRYEQSIGEGYLLYMIARADIKCESKEIESYLAESHGQYTRATEFRKQALEQEKDLPGPVKGALSYRVAVGTKDVKGKDRIPLLIAALEYAGSDRSSLHMLLGDTYASIGDKEKAIEQYRFAIIAAGMDEERIRKEVRNKYLQLGYTRGVKEIDEWLAAMSRSSRRR